MKRNNRITVVIGVLGASLVAVLLGYALAPGASEGRQMIESGGKSRPTKSVRPGPASSSKPVVPVETRRKRLKRPVVIDELADLSDADRRLYGAVQSALDNEDFDAVRAASSAAYKSANAAVRLQAVEALGWFGEKALPELTPMMADADSNVSQSACDAWESGLSEMESASDRIKVAQMALRVISNPDALTMIGSQFSNAATELIDGADGKKADEYRVQVLQGIVDIMGDESNAARTAAAKDIYESVTGNEWVSIAEAEKYLADPDNYEAPE